MLSTQYSEFCPDSILTHQDRKYKGAKFKEGNHSILSLNVKFESIVSHGSSYKLEKSLGGQNLGSSCIQLVTEDVELEEITQGELDNRINKSFLGTPSI